MDWYNANGEKLKHAVKVEIDGVECWKMNPGADTAWREAHGYIYDHNPIPPPVPEPEHVFTKLKIRRAMRKLGIEGKLNALLEASETFANDWADAQEIDLADPVLVSALALGSVTQEEIEAIRTAITTGDLDVTVEDVVEEPSNEESVDPQETDSEEVTEQEGESEETTEQDGEQEAQGE